MKRGFTLIEMMIVVALIGILLAVILPTLGMMISKNREKATMGNLGSLQTAISTYYGHNEEWPRGDIAGDENPVGAMGESDFVAALVPDYLDKIPPAMLKTSIAENQSTRTYTNEMNGTSTYRGITNDGGWWYHVGSHTLRINSLETDTYGVFYSDYE